MFLNLGRMPGAGVSRPETYRLQFASAMGARPDADLRLEGGVSKVHEFLVSRLDMESLRANYAGRKKDSPQSLSNIRRVQRDLGSLKALALTDDDVTQYRERLQAEYRPATVNRLLQLFSNRGTAALARSHFCRSDF